MPKVIVLSGYSPTSADADERREIGDAAVASAASPLTLRAFARCDDVYCAAGPVPPRRRELDGFRDDTRAGQRGVCRDFDIGIMV
jgi:hypothetical protein